MVNRNRSAKDWVLSYLQCHAQTLISSLGRLTRFPYSSAMTILVVAVSMTLPSGFYLLVENFAQLIGNVDTNNYISVYLKPKISNQAGRRIEKELSEKPWIKNTKFISKEQAMSEFREFSGFNDALSALDSNPLPVVVQIEPDEGIKQPFELNQKIIELEMVSGVDSAQIDLQWVARLEAIMEVFRRAAFLLAILLGLAVIFIVSNTIRLELQNRHDEVVVAKLVGATSGFIRRPFLYSAFWYGILGSLLGLIMISLIMRFLRSPIDDLIFLYDGRFQIDGFDFGEGMMMVALSVGLAVLGAWLVLGSYLRDLRVQ